MNIRSLPKRPLPYGSLKKKKRFEAGNRPATKVKASQKILKLRKAA